MRSRMYAAAFRIGIWIATRGGEKMMNEKLKRMLAANAVVLILAGRLTVEDVSPMLQPIVDEMMAEPAAAE